MNNDNRNNTNQSKDAPHTNAAAASPGAQAQGSQGNQSQGTPSGSSANTNAGNFANDPKRAQEAGRKGGQS